MSTEPDTYNAPRHGWCCFHCGDRFPSTPEGIKAAREHFGPTPDWEPACIERRTQPDDVLLKRTREAEAQAQEAWQRTNAAENEAEATACSLSSWQSAIKGAKTAHDARCVVESLEGRVLTAEAVLAELWRTHPIATNHATVTVCGPGTYYPLTPPQQQKATS